MASYSFILGVVVLLLVVHNPTKTESSSLFGRGPKKKCNDGGDA